MDNERKFRIAMLGHKRIPSREGGIEVVVEQLSSRMAALGHHVTCFNRKGHHVSGKEYNAPKISEWNGVQIRSVFTIDKGGLAALSASVSAALRAAFGKFDVVHFHAEGPCAMIWLPKLFGKRCIATVHGLDHRSEKWQGRFAQKYILFGEKMAVRYADEIIVLSPSIQNYFTEQYGRKTNLIPNGAICPEKRAPERILEQFGLQGNDYILFLGRIVRGKGVEYLLSAYAQMHTSKKLVIAGGASDSSDFLQKMKDMAKRDDRIIFTGFVQGQLLDELYSNAYLYCLPSDLEGMPLSLLEAMSYGNCCVVSDIPECTEVVEDKGVSFQRGNVEDLRDQLQLLCDRPELVKQYREGSAEFILNKYSWDAVTEQTLMLYEKDELRRFQSNRSHDTFVNKEKFVYFNKNN